MTKEETAYYLGFKQGCLAAAVCIRKQRDANEFNSWEELIEALRAPEFFDRDGKEIVS